MNGSSSTGHGRLDDAVLRVDAYQRRRASVAVLIAVQRNSARTSPRAWPA